MVTAANSGSGVDEVQARVDRLRAAANEAAKFAKSFQSNSEASSNDGFSDASTPTRHRLAGRYRFWTAWKLIFTAILCCAR